YGDENTGDARGCGAGNLMLAVDNEGELYPCRHLPYNDRYAKDSIEEYLKKSEFLRNLIELKTSPARCGDCNSRSNCLPCFSYGYKIFGNLNRSADACRIYQK
ncbi:MAG: SPASM domain-containing protein, partial [Mobilitalea sp.]